VNVCASGTGCSSAALLGNVVGIAAGSNHTCALVASGNVMCWGDASAGQVGDGTIGDGSGLRLSPTYVCATGTSCGAGSPNLLGNVAAIAAGDFHTCAVTADGHVLCWGNNTSGQIGDGTTGDGSGHNLNPTYVCPSGTGCTAGTSLSGVVAVAPGSDHTCAATSDGKLRCWGDNHYAEPGDGNPPGAPWWKLNPVSACATPGAGPACAGGGALASGAVQTVSHYSVVIP
jgi:alpha-tubulin suppressor-like RCC1 family protein